MKHHLGRAAALAAMTLCGAAAAAPLDADTLQPSLYVQYRFGGDAAAPGGLNLGLQWSWSERAIDALAQRLDPEHRANAGSIAQGSHALSAQRPPPVRLDWSSQRRLDLQLAGASWIGWQPAVLNADGSQSGGFRWNRGVTWMLIGLAATVATVSAFDSDTEYNEFNNNNSGSSEGCSVVSGNGTSVSVVSGDCSPPDPDIGG